jgi:hypothetical protein
MTSHTRYVFVVDGIYQGQKFLNDIDTVFLVKDLNLECLKKLN